MLPSTLTLESYFVAIAYISIIITYLGIKVMKMFHVGKFITIFFSLNNSIASISDKYLYWESKYLSSIPQHYHRFNFLST